MIPDTLHTVAFDTLRVVVRDTSSEMSKFEWTTVKQQWLWITVTALGLWFALRQVRIASIASLLQVEVMLFDNLRRIDEYTGEKLTLDGHKNKGETVDEKEEEAVVRKQLGAVQNYLNSLDRFCGCVRRRIISKRHARTEYESVLRDAMTTHKKFIQPFVSDFDKSFPNLTALSKEWGI